MRTLPGLFFIMRFEKKPETPENQLKLLVSRGLQISNEPQFYRYLKNIGYYRLTGYMYPFQNSDGSHTFKSGTKFETILRHYLFDKKLRLLILDYIERIEISLRAAVTNHMSATFGAHWYLHDSCFYSSDWHSRFLINTKETVRKSNEDFIRQYKLKYANPEEPPSWMIMETLTFGELTSLFENLKDGKEKKDIATHFNSKVSILESWLRSLNFVRNACAHHSRLWNRKLPLKPLIPVRKGNRFLIHVEEDTNKRLYGILSCLLYLIKVISPQTRFQERVKVLFEEFPDVNIRHIGFPQTWLEEDIWK